MLARPKLIVYYKILISHIQVMGLMPFFAKNLQSKRGINGLRAWEYLARLPITVLTPDCIFQNVFGTSNDPGSEDRLFFARVVISSITPFLFLLLTAAVWVVICFQNKSAAKNFGSYIFASLVVLYFIYCPSVVYFALQNLNCADVYGDGYRLRLDLD
jgi:hypothetical protein